MNAEQNINNQPKPQELGATKEDPHEVFRKTLETSRQTMDMLVGFATQNGVAPFTNRRRKRIFNSVLH